MNREVIVDHLRKCGFDAQLDTDGSELTVRTKIIERDVVLKHSFPNELLYMPKFSLVGASDFGSLAHVLPMEGCDEGEVCVHHTESVSVNFEVPALAYEGSLKRHLARLERAIFDPEWNRAELLREFQTLWNMFCHQTGSNRRLYLACESASIPSLQVKMHIQDQSSGVASHFIGISHHVAADEKHRELRRSLRWDKRQVKGKSLILQLSSLEPSPTKHESLEAWYVQCFKHLHPDYEQVLVRFRKRRSKEYWLVFGVSNHSLHIWFAVHLVSQSKNSLPISPSELQGWNLKAIPVHALDPESIVPRGGGELSLATKSVLLVGCGSVGSELAHRLASTGLGKLTLSDPENFTEDNLYRHTLCVSHIGFSKSSCLTIDLRRRYPWLQADDEHHRLEDLRDEEKLIGFDLVIVAIGSPTIERQFQDFTTKQSISTPVMNIWLEANGIGGHATLTIPNSKGCLLCAYVDPLTLSRGLSSNLNFLKPDQNFTENRRGCGDLFLPYSAIASNHTATMSADLATRFLLGRIKSSSKVSWKGEATAARERGLNTSYRYENFCESLKVLPLFHSECDVCGSS